MRRIDNHFYPLMNRDLWMLCSINSVSYFDYANYNTWSYNKIVEIVFMSLFFIYPLRCLFKVQCHENIDRISFKFEYTHISMRAFEWYTNCKHRFRTKEDMTIVIYNDVTSGLQTDQTSGLTSSIDRVYETLFNESKHDYIRTRNKGDIGIYALRSLLTHFET